MMATSFSGAWSYRSLINDPDLSIAFDNLRFGAGTLTLTEPESGKIGGSLGGPGWSLSLAGTATDGSPPGLAVAGPWHDQRRGVGL
jgi:hypothetical protein